MSNRLFVGWRFINSVCVSTTHTRFENVFFFMGKKEYPMKSKCFSTLHSFLQSVSWILTDEMIFLGLRHTWHFCTQYCDITIKTLLLQFKIFSVLRHFVLKFSPKNIFNSDNKKIIWCKISFYCIVFLSEYLSIAILCKKCCVFLMQLVLQWKLSLV